MVYWAKGPIQGHSIVREQVDTSMGVQDTGWAKWSSFKVPRSMFENEFHIGLIGQRSKGLA